MTNQLKDLSFLELFIINTITYFDLFDYPLTLNEIYSYLYTGGMAGGEYSILEIEQNLNFNPKLKKIITTKRGFYFLKGREKIIRIRLNRYFLADKKFKLCLKAVRIFKFFPFIKLVAVCNNLAYLNARRESDIDLFIITKAKRIWLIRLAAILVITILGLRPPKIKIQDKLCLSFYITEDNLNLSKVQIAPDDIYLVYWLAGLFPVYQRDEYYNKLMQANSWLKRYLPNHQPKQIGYRYRVEDTKFSRFVYSLKERILSGFLGDMLDRLAKWLNLKLVSQNKKDLAINDDTRVIINDGMLKFHENDRRMEILKMFEKKRQELIDHI